MNAKFYLGADHAGYETKEEIQKYLQRTGNESVDLGTHSNDSVDYPDYAVKVARKVAKDKGSFGVLVCGTGIGMSIAANKIKGIRAAHVTSVNEAKLAREHNDANVLCVGARINSPTEIKKMIKAFLAEKPSKVKRHKARVEKLNKL